MKKLTIYSLLFQRLLLDPSVLLRPEDDLEDETKIRYRDYTVNEDDPIKERVRKTYHKMHTFQTVDFVKQKRKQWLKFNHARMDIKEALELLNTLVDESDPDTDLPNIVHAFQTAERARYLTQYTKCAFIKSQLTKKRIFK